MKLQRRQIGYLLIVLLALVAGIVLFLTKPKADEKSREIGPNRPPFEVINGDGQVSADQMAQVETVLKKDKLMDVVSQAYGFPYHRYISIHLAADDDGYRQILNWDGKHSSDQIDKEVKATEGLAHGDDVYVNLAKRKTDADLREVLAHEFTHVLFYQNGVQIPSWINEGLAQRIGIEQQDQGLPDVLQTAHQDRIEMSFLKLKSQGKELQLLDTSLDTIHTTVSQGYNVELFDWLAVQHLIQTNSLAKMKAYLTLTQHKTAYDPFLKTFGQSTRSYEINMNALLSEQAAQPDHGVIITFHWDNPNNDAQVSIKQADQTNWQVANPPTGNYAITVLPDGTVQGLDGVRSVKATTKPNPSFLFLNVMMAQPLQASGKSYTQYGFAFKRGYGMYYLSNSFRLFQDKSNQMQVNNKIAGMEITSVTRVQ